MVSSVIRIFLACALCALASTCVAQIFKVTGSDGRISYTDRPPRDVGRTSTVTALRIADSPAQTPVAPTTLAKPKAQPKDTVPLRPEPYSPLFDSSKRLVMFSTASCKYCVKAKNYLGAKGASFDDLDIDRNAIAAEEFKKLGGRGVPLFVYKGRTMTGFSEAGLDAMLSL